MTMASSGKYRRSPGERRPTGQPIELTLLGGAYGGRMVARQPGDETQGGRVVFVQGGIPGETVRGELTTEKRSFAEARAIKITTPSAERATPPCIYFGENGLNRGAAPAGNDLPGERGACGGCQYQHIEYAAQLELKRGIVADLMRRQARLGEVEVAPTIASPEQWNYRNRARWVVDAEGMLCYHQAASERLLQVNLCHIIQPVLVEVLAALNDPRWRLPLRTLVAEVTARSATPWKPLAGTAVSEHEIMLVLHPRAGTRRRDLRLLASEIGTALPMLNGLVMARTSHTGEQVEASGPLWGTTFLDTRLAGHRFRLAPLTFFQVNDAAAELLVERVVEAVGPVGGQSVLDIYAGAGTFAVPIAQRAEQVLAIENDPQAIDDAHRSVEVNSLTNLHVLPGDAAAELNGLPRRAASVAVLDPPRAGLGAQVIDELARIEVGRIVYVSCDPATLARDLRRFAELGYTVESIQPIDLFPQTYHIETIVVLTRE